MRITRSPRWSGAPAVVGQGDADESAGEDGPGQGDERVDHAGVALGTDQESFQASVVPRIGVTPPPHRFPA